MSDAVQPATTQLHSRAAANNAAWCDLVCQTHGVVTRTTAEAWVAAQRTPPFYPDLVTLVPDSPIAELLEQIDSSPGCSIKDSFASLDLTAGGFEVLFEAEWLVRSPTDVGALATSELDWQVVSTAEELGGWELDWAAPDRSAGIFRHELLQHSNVAVWACRTGDATCGGAIVNIDAGLAGLSNFWVRSDVSPAEVLESLLARTTTTYPGANLCTYASGQEGSLLKELGFSEVGPLRIWIKPAD